MKLNWKVRFHSYKLNQILTELIYKSFCEASYDRQDLNHFNNFLDYIHGKAYNFPYELVHENRYMMMLDFLMNYDENEDI